MLSKYSRPVNVLAVVAGAIFLAIVAGQLRYDGADRSERVGNVEEPYADDIVAVTRAESDVSGGERAASGSPGNTTSTSSPSTIEAADTSDETAEILASESPTAQATRLVPSLNDTVVGRPFPLSATMADKCKEAVATGDGAWQCREIFEWLNAFAQEPRDSKWATEIEALFWGSNAVESGMFRIRALECRQSICVGELASEFGQYVSPERGTVLDRRVDTEEPVLNEYEPHVSGAVVTISLRIFTRKYFAGDATGSELVE